MAKKDYTVKIQSTCPVSLTFSDGDVGRYDRKLRELSDHYDHLSRVVKRISGHGHEVEYRFKILRSLKRVIIHYGQTPKLIDDRIFHMLMVSLKKLRHEQARAIPLFRDTGEKFNESYLIELAIYFEQSSVYVDHDYRNTRIDFVDTYKKATAIVATNYIGMHAPIIFEEEFHRQSLDSGTVQSAESKETYYRTNSNNLLHIANQLLTRHVDLKQQMAGKIPA